MSNANATVHLAGVPLTRSRHAGAFFLTDEEKFRVLMPFIPEGFAQGDLAAHIVNRLTRDVFHAPTH